MQHHEAEPQRIALPTDIRGAIADAFREVAGRMEQEVEAGTRSSRFDVYDILEMMTKVADRIAPPAPAPKVKRPRRSR